MALGFIAGKKRVDSLTGSKKRKRGNAEEDAARIAAANARRVAATADKTKKLEELEKNPAKRSYMQDKAKRDIEREYNISMAQGDLDSLDARQRQKKRKSDEWQAKNPNKDPMLNPHLNVTGVTDSAERKELESKLAKANEKSSFDQGRDRAVEILGDEGLGRLEEDADIRDLLKQSEGREEELAKYTKMAEGQLDRQRGLTSRYEKMADEGMSPEAREARRVAESQLMAKQEQMAGMRLGAAMGGAKGAAAMAQQRSLAAQSMQARAGIERDIFLQNEAAKERGLAGMAASLSGEQAAITGIGQGQQMQQAAFESRRSAVGEMKAFDIGQAAAEKELIATMGLQYEQMSSAEKAAKMAADAQVAAGKAQCHIAGTQVLMKDGSYKNIEDIKIGDVVMIGGKVLGCGSVINQESLYTMNGEVFTASHLIYDSQTKMYVRADETAGCTLFKKESDDIVYPLLTENRCYVTSFVSGDLGMETDYREEREDITYTMKGLGYGR